MTEMNKINATELTNDELEFVTGGSSEDVALFQALAVEKGYGSGRGLAGKMAQANMYKAVGMETVNWNISTGEPAVFYDYAGGTHSFEEVFAKMQALPHK